MIFQEVSQYCQAPNEKKRSHCSSERASSSFVLWELLLYHFWGVQFLVSVMMAFQVRFGVGAALHTTTANNLHKVDNISDIEDSKSQSLATISGQQKQK